MWVVGFPVAGGIDAEAEGSIERNGLWILGFQTQRLKSTCRMFNYFFDQHPSNSQSSKRRRDVDVPDPSDAWIMRVGVNIETADSGERSVICKNYKENLAVAGKSIFPCAHSIFILLRNSWPSCAA